MKNKKDKIERISKDLYVHHISDETKREWNEKRRSKDKVYELIESNGFHHRKDGMVGTIYYVQDKKIIEIGYELSGVPESDILLAPMDLRFWNIPEKIEIEKEEQINILEKLRKWLHDEKIRSNIDLPSKIEYEDIKCNWINCSQFRLKGKAYCVEHFTKNLLINE